MTCSAGTCGRYAEPLRVQEIAFDPYNATQLANQTTMDGLSPVKF